MKKGKLYQYYIDIKYFFIGLYRQRQLIYELALRDFKLRNKGTALGLIWNYLKPITFILMLWFLFGIGFKGAMKHSDVPYLFYLISGMTVWYFFSENINSLTTIINKYDFLIEKSDFGMGMLHISHLLSNVINHSIFVVMSIIIGIVYSWFAGIYILQIIYYFAALFLLLLGLSWITSSTVLFYEDIKNLVALLLQFGFWITPLFWNINLIPYNYQWLVKLNPLYYIVTGYRDSIIYKIPFWEKPLETLYFWSITILIIICGAVIFRRLRPHFEEVL